MLIIPASSSACPVILLEVGGNPLPDQLPSLSDAQRALTSPDDGTLAVAAISLVAWMALADPRRVHPDRSRISAARHHHTRAARVRLPQARRPKPGHRRPAAVRRHQQITAPQRPGRPAREPHRRPTHSRPETPHVRRQRADASRRPQEPRQGRNCPLPGAERGVAVDDRPDQLGSGPATARSPNSTPRSWADAQTSSPQAPSSDCPPRPPTWIMPRTR